MYIYAKADTRGIVKDYEHADVADNTGGIKTWSMKFYDGKTNNPDLESQGYVKTYLNEFLYPTFETYYDLFTLTDKTLRQPTNIPEPSNQQIQAQLANQDANSRQVIQDNADLKKQLAELLAKMNGGGD